MFWSIMRLKNYFFINALKDWTDAMIESIEQVSYHILVMILPMVIYHLFIKEDKLNRKKFISFLFGTLFISLFLTMTNPVLFSDGYHYDFRVIPIIIAFLYDGVKPGVMLVGLMLMYRYWFGGNGFYVTLVNYFIAAVALILISRNFSSYPLRKKLYSISLFFWGIAFTRAISLLLLNELAQLISMMLFSFLTYVTLLILVLIIENLDIQIVYKKQIIDSERLNTISQLAASVAHEVRNPMTSVKGFLQLMKTNDNLNEKQMKYIAISLEELKRTEGVINDYLSLAKPGKEVKEEIQISFEVQSAIDIITSYTNTHNIAIFSSIEEGLFIKGNRSELKQALLNIMKNGVEAIDSNGTLTINTYKKNNNVCIEIIDNGIGMTKKQIQNLGTPYYSTKIKGTGVGLTITYNIIKEMNGTISVTSKKDVGTTFCIELPLLMINATAVYDKAEVL
ncbi:ATP-binding protein [Bacillus capparidis]|nr:two-component system sporulation sensor kinase B [Bacillus capparidis]